MRRISNTAAMSSAVASLAARQHGMVSRAQMRQIGLCDDRIDSWVRAGRLRRVVSAVYAVGHHRLTEQGRLSAAILAC